MIMPATTLPVSATDPHASLLDGLLDALLSERRLLDELGAIMLRQRAAVAADDLQGVDDSVYALQRVLFTVSAARKRRRTLNVRLGFDEETPLHELMDAVRPRASDVLLRAFEHLRRSARALSREVAVNRDVLRSALATGDEYVRLLTGADATAVGYGEPNVRREAPGAPRLMDRQA